MSEDKDRITPADVTVSVLVALASIASIVGAVLAILLFIKG